MFEKDIKGFARLYLGEGVKYLILDEFHYAKLGGKNLKYLFDYHQDKKIIISGSSAADLTIRAIEYLVGRVIVLTLWPFSFAEFLDAKDKELFKIWQESTVSQLKVAPLKSKLDHYLEEYLIYGGYPEVVLQADEAIKKTLLKNLFSILFLREVKDFLALADEEKLRNLIRGLALQTGNLVSYQELTQVSGLDFKTLKSYLSFLEKVFICHLLPGLYWKILFLLLWQSS